MNIDTFIEIGSQHKICEDYIISGNDPVPYVILSDGCSTSHNTEMGARILTHLAKQYLKYNADNLSDIDYWELGTWVIHNAEQTARQLGLSTSCLTATLIVAYRIDNRIRIMIYGDGGFITIDNYDNIEMRSIEFTKNAPYYLAYLIDSTRHTLYQNSDPTKTIIRHHADGSKTKTAVDYDRPLDFTIPTHIHPIILIASDGIDSFLKTESNGASTYLKSDEIIKPCVAFKNFKGEFLKRRFNKQMITFSKNNIEHFDDLSIGAFLKLEEM